MFGLAVLSTADTVRAELAEQVELWQTVTFCPTAYLFASLTFSTVHDVQSSASTCFAVPPSTYGSNALSPSSRQSCTAPTYVSLLFWLWKLISVTT